MPINNITDNFKTSSSQSVRSLGLLTEKINSNIWETKEKDKWQNLKITAWQSHLQQLIRLQTEITYISH